MAIKEPVYNPKMDKMQPIHLSSFLLKASLKNSRNQ